MEKDYYIPFGTQSNKKCMKECLASNDCTGWEFTYGFVADENKRCRIWIGRVRSRWSERASTNYALIEALILKVSFS